METVLEVRFLRLIDQVYPFCGIFCECLQSLSKHNRSVQQLEPDSLQVSGPFLFAYRPPAC